MYVFNEFAGGWEIIGLAMIFVVEGLFGTGAGAITDGGVRYAGGCVMSLVSSSRMR